VFVRAKEFSKKIAKINKINFSNVNSAIHASMMNACS